MNSERWQQINRLFESAVELPPADREAFVNEVCADDIALREELESLLASHAEAEDFLEEPAVREVAEVVLGIDKKLKKNQIIGHFRILSELGKGGQGAVYKVLDTKLNRTVALKTLPPELTIDETSRKRFEREAQLASALDHPNICTIHDLIEIDGAHFIVMQFVEGQNIRQLVNGQPLELKSALKIAVQVCDALATAHQEKIIHRDIKAHNIVVTGKGQAKILDFGLAKLTLEKAGGTEQSELTLQGSPYGTPSYAAPEQSRGERVDHRADIFSTGVLLYEMLTGKSAFEGKTAIDVRYAVLQDQPRPIEERRGAAIPAELQKIVERALAKKPDDRYQQMSAMRDQLIEVLRALPENGERSETARFLDGFAPLAPRHLLRSRSFRARLLAALAVVLIASLAVTGVMIYRRSLNLKRAAENASRAEELARQGRFFEAYDLVVEAQEYLPDDDRIRRLMPVVSDEISVITEPAGAEVYVKRFAPDQAGNFPARQLLGKTPVKALRIARGSYVLDVEKEGFAFVNRTISGAPEIFWEMSFNPPPIEINLRLKRAAEIPEKMTLVEGGDYSLVSWHKPTERKVRLDDFLIDKYEVSNREYKEFISAGGYLKKQFWKYPFAKNAGTITFEEAISEFKDKTGLQAPRSWVNQTYPEGKADHPVTDITWYEAAAYAEFRGKSLPSIFQWEKAARNGLFTQSPGGVLPWGFFQKDDSLEYRANISGKDTVPIDSFEFGQSPFGAFNMAGNVSEWCFNEITEGFATSGGSWGEPPYGFGSISGFPGFYFSNKLGFRCVKNLGAGDAQEEEEEEDRAKIDPAKAIPVHSRTSAAEFRSWLPFYRYDQTPVEAQILEIKETDEWRREKISFTGADDEQVLAYLYLPKNCKRPLQVIQYVPAGDVFGRFASVPQHVENFMSPHIKAGRAVFAVVLKGFIEREQPPEYRAAPVGSIKFRERIVKHAIDLRRGLDYLETRADLDRERVIFWGYSTGGELGLIFTAVENRYRAVVLIGVGLSPDVKEWISEANKANFAPHIKAPKLMLNGRYDEQFAWKTSAEPLYKLLSEPKRLELFDGGHTPPPEIAVPLIGKWLDETVGAVQNE